MFLKSGFVTESKRGWAKVNFDGDENLPSDWLQQVFQSTHEDQEVSTLAKGSHVRCLMDEHLEDGVILGAVYSDKDAVPGASDNVWTKVFSDGTAITYDKDAKKLTATVANGGTAELTAKTFTLTGDLAVTGNISATGNAAITGDVSAANVTASGDVKVGLITLATHQHPNGNFGNPTGGPIP